MADSCLPPSSIVRRINDRRILLTSGRSWQQTYTNVGIPRPPITIDRESFILTTQFTTHARHLAVEVPAKMATPAALLCLAAQPELSCTWSKRAIRGPYKIMLHLARDPFLRPGFKTSAHHLHDSNFLRLLSPVTAALARGRHV